MVSDPEPSLIGIKLVEDCHDPPGRPSSVWEVEKNWSVLFQGSLRDALTLLSMDRGLPLDGLPGTFFDEVQDGAPAPGADSKRECFTPSPDRHCIGFKWELPVDHGNEVQSDSVRFDLGFYTEQCRHNDGSGMNDEPVDGDELAL